VVMNTRSSGAFVALCLTDSLRSRDCLLLQPPR
jgi:hypothetical protein